MDELILVIIAGAIGAGSSIVGAIIGARLGARYEAEIRWRNRPKPIINDCWLGTEEGKISSLEIKNIGKTTACNCTVKEVLRDKGKFWYYREPWQFYHDGRGMDVHPMQPVVIPWIRYNSESKELVFINGKRSLYASISKISFPITGRITLYAHDSEPDDYEYKIRLLNGHPYVQTATNRNYAGVKIPESEFDDHE